MQHSARDIELGLQVISQKVLRSDSNPFTPGSMMCFQHSSAVVVLIFVSLFLAGLFNCAGAQDYRVIGYVEDSESGERIAGVHVYSNQRRVSAVTNQYGFYSLNTPVQEFRISVSHISYESTVIDLKLIADTVLTIRLDPRIALMEEMSTPLIHLKLRFEPSLNDSDLLI